MKKVVCVAVALVCVFLIGANIGYNKAIKDAYLIEANENTYHIEFDGVVHEYDYE
jgi:hypothetical protein